jgi:hypothetical protein
MLPKILVTTGCSYGKFANAFFDNGISNTNALELVIDLHASSLGANHQMISVIECVNKLLSLGVKPNDIFVIAEFSEIARKDIVIQNDFLVNEIDKTIFIENVNGKDWVHGPVEYPDTIILKHTDYIKNIVNNLKVKKAFPGDYTKFHNYYVINPEKKYQPKFPNQIIQSILDTYVDSIDIKMNHSNIHTIDRINVEFVDRAINYFQNILTTEQYLKSKEIKHKFCLINNQFSMYDNNGLQVAKKSKEVKGEHYLVQNYRNSKQIWEINSMIKILYQMIDWNNWWFYENKDKNIIWGGIDEFAIDKYGIKVYTDRNSDINLFGQHPTKQVYQDLIVNHLMKEYF